MYLKDNKQSIYSAAYIMPSGGSNLGSNVKHRNHLHLLEIMMEDEVYKRISDAKSLMSVFEILKSYPTIGDFLAFQYAIDLNYSNLIDFSEMSFVVPGPGARDGIHKCFSDLGGLSEVDIIKLMADKQEEEFKRLNLDFKDLWGRPLQLIDCQNIFCEVDKYSRIAHPAYNGLSGRTRIKQKFKPNSKPMNFSLPDKWGLKYKIENR